MKTALLALATIICIGGAAHAKSPLKLDNTIFAKAGQTYRIDPYLIYSIALVESRYIAKDGLVRPHPYAIHVNSTPPKSYYPATKEQAETILKKELQYTNNIDIGLMQVNYGYHKKKISTPVDLLDIHKNITIASNILRIALNSTKNPIIGAGRYHNWRDEKLSWAYGFRALRLSEKLKKGDKS